MALLSGSQETLGTPGTLEITASDSIIEDTPYHLLQSPEGHLRAQVCHKITVHINATCHHLDIKGQTGQTGQTLHFRDHHLPICRQQPMALPSTQLVQL